MSGRVHGKLENATDEDKRFVLETLDTEITVSETGVLTIGFAIPDAKLSIETTELRAGR